MTDALLSANRTQRAAGWRPARASVYLSARTPMPSNRDFLSFAASAA